MEGYETDRPARAWAYVWFVALIAGFICSAVAVSSNSREQDMTTVLEIRAAERRTYEARIKALEAHIRELKTKRKKE